MQKISVKGEIITNDNKWIYDYFGMDSTCPKDVESLLAKANGGDVIVDINSGGGDIFAGSEIYTMLRKYSGNVEIHIVGIAASAASVIAMAGKSKISPTALFMIHNVSSYASGDCNEFEKQADILKTANQSIANAYIEKTGLSNENLLQMMNAETWLTSKQAVEKGFVDEVLFEDNISLRNDFGGLNNTVISKLRNLIPKNKFNSEQEKLKLLKLKGEYQHEIF